MRRGVLAAALIAGCASWGGVPDAELPAQPIAIYYRTPEEARVRAEALRRASSGSPGVSAEGPTLVGSKAYLRADADALGRFLENAFGTDRGAPETHLGRLALLDPRSGDVAFVEGALRGAVPQAWSRDRAALLFAQPTAPGSRDVQIFEWSAEDRTVRRITVGPPVHSQACYGPDGRTVVTAVELSGDRATSRIRISGPGGREPFTNLSEGPADYSPTCAPDGSAVVFTRSANTARSEIWIAAAPFHAATRLLAPGRDPRFADTGHWIVYTAASGRAGRLFRIRADGSGRAPIGAGGSGEGWPTASPDGKLVAYVASGGSGSRLLVRRFDGSGDRILIASGEGEHPVW
jgi:Tol biopolymer transport system component